MRNLKRALSLALSSVMLLGMMVVGTSAASYPDVDAQDNLEAIEVLDILGVMSGDENGKFNPDAKITRNEMAVVMTHLLKLNAGGTSPFTDVPSWAQPYVSAIYANGVTAGTSATTYGGSNNVTAVEAALMVMKSLGYFGYQGEFADNWSLAVVKQATKINLFNGIDAAATDAITRSEAAQMCLNALEATVTVVTEEGGLAVDGNGISVNVKPSYSYASAKNTDFDYCGRSLTDGTMQLCEKLYGEKLHKDITGEKTDKFGRPANEWTYSGKAVTTPKAADAVYTAEVSAKTLYNDLSLSAAEDANVYVDSKTVESDPFKLTKTGTDADKKIGGNGTLVEAYKIMENDGTLESVKLVVVNTKAGEITKVTPAKDGDPATVTVKGVTKAYETTGYEKGDIVVYTMADGEIQSMALATKVEAAEVTKVTGDTSFVAGGTTYKYGANIAATLKTGDVGSTQDLYLDANGYVVYIKEFEGSSDYAYVLKTGEESGRFETNYYAQLLTADGSVVEAKVTKADDVTSDNGDQAMESAVEALAGEIVKYSKNSKDEYTVSTMTADYDAKGSVDINKGESKMTFDNTAVYANSKTLFLVQNGTGDKATYTAYTGYANVPNMTSSSAEYVVYCESSQATVVFVKGVAAAGDNQLVYVLGSKDGTVVNDSDAGKYYVYKAVVDGEITTINLDSEISADTMFSNLVKDDYKVVDVSASTTYSDDKAQDSYVITKATLNGDYENDVLAIDQKSPYDTSFAVSSDIEVYEVTTGDKIEAGSTGSLVDNATVTLVIENAEVVAAFVIVK